MSQSVKTTGRKPRIALMGEFSAGKSSLANVLMRQSFSPTRITATQLPPLWYAKGEGAPIRIDDQGQENLLPDGNLEAAAIDDTIAIRLFKDVEFLEHCDLIDMPGSSDPNITVDVWQSVLPLADAVIWCTPATQAWRQSEAALWEEYADRLSAHSLLLVTRIDKILHGKDRNRLLKRLERETGDVFRSILPVSLVASEIETLEQAEKRSSGLAALQDEIGKLISDLGPVIEQTSQTDFRALQSLGTQAVAQKSDTGSARQVRPQPKAKDVGGAVVELPQRKVAPKRVGTVGQRRSRKRSETSSSLI